MGSIDEFISTPLLIAAGLGVLLFLFLLIIKLRNTAKASFIFFFVTWCLVNGGFDPGDVGAGDSPNKDYEMIRFGCDGFNIKVEDEVVPSGFINKNIDNILQILLEK